MTDRSTAATRPHVVARRRRHRVRRLGLVALAGLFAWVLIGLPIFVFPPTGSLPKHSDVALVLGGDTAQRIALAQKLLADGTVDEMLWSTPGRQDAGTARVVDRDCAILAHLICFDPSPSTTQGEARELGQQARLHGWTSAIVISQSAHLQRARLIVGRCFSGALTMADSGEPPQGGWGWEYLYQTLATVKAWIHPGC